jgi:hypothetical protein
MKDEVKAKLAKVYRRGGPAVAQLRLVRGKPYNMTKLFADRAKTMITENFTNNPQKRLLLAECGNGVLCGNHINNS